MDLVALGERLRTERVRRGVTLEGLAAASGVSRSMISTIERGLKAPTVIVLARLATGLGTTAARLLDESTRAKVMVIRHEQQRALVDPGGWERRILSPNLPGVEFEFIRTTVPPHVVLGEFAAHAAGSREYVAVESGRLTVTVAGEEHLLEAGDSLYYDGDQVHSFANHHDAACVYYTAMEVP